MAGGERREMRHTSALQEARDLVSLVFGHVGQDLGCSVHVAPQHGRLVLDDVQRQSIPIDVHVLVRDVDPIMRGDVSQERHRPNKI